MHSTKSLMEYVRDRQPFARVRRTRKGIALFALVIFVGYLVVMPLMDAGVEAVSKWINDKGSEHYERPHLTAVASAAEIPSETIQAYVTGYNLVPGQTDSTPCIGASGKNLCGRRDTVACPRIYPLGTLVEIGSQRYTCEDRLHPKYDDRFDINCDQDIACTRAVTGIKSVRIYK